MQKTGYLIAIAIATLATALYMFQSPGAEGDRLSYQTQLVALGDIESLVNASGAIKPMVTVEVGSELSGVISELLVDFNSSVKKGQLIARLDSRTVRARLRQAEADLAMAKANLAQQQASLARSGAQLTRAQNAHKRQRELLARQLTSEADVDNSRANLLVAEAEAALSQALVSASRAQIQQREAQLEQANLDLERTDIRSPLAGMIINRQVDVGQTVAASLSAPVLFVIAQDLSRMQIEADIDEADIGKLKQGQLVRFTVDAYPTVKYQGDVLQVRKAAKTVSNVVTYTVIIAANNANGSLLPGMTANVDIILGRQADVLKVPNAALRFRPAKMSASESRGEQRLNLQIMNLNLDEEQKKLVAPIVESFLAELKAFREENKGSWNADRGINRLRQKLNNQLKAVLTESQFDQFRTAGRQHRKSGGSGGEVWILQDGAPKRVAVQMGLAGDEYTEVLGETLKQGDAVIVRVSRQAAPS